MLTTTSSNPARRETSFRRRLFGGLAALLVPAATVAFGTAPASAASSWTRNYDCGNGIAQVHYVTTSSSGGTLARADGFAISFYAGHGQIKEIDVRELDTVNYATHGQYYDYADWGMGSSRFSKTGLPTYYFPWLRASSRPELVIWATTLDNAACEVADRLRLNAANAPVRWAGAAHRTGACRTGGSALGEVVELVLASAVEPRRDPRAA